MAAHPGRNASPAFIWERMEGIYRIVFTGVVVGAEEGWDPYAPRAEERLRTTRPFLFHLE